MSDQEPLTDKLELIQAQLAAIVEHSIYAIYSYDFDGKILSWNKSAEELYGYSFDEISGFGLNRIIPAERFNEAMETIVPTIRKGGYIRQLETVRQHKDGSRVEVELTVSPVKNASGVPIALSVIARDVSKRRKAYRDLHNSNQLLNKILDHTQDLVWAKDRSGNMTMGNKAAIDLIGSGDPAKVIGKGARELISDPVQSLHVMLNDERIMQTGQTEVVEEKFGGGIYQSIKSALKDESGNIIGLVGISRDVTAAREAEERLRDAEKRYRFMVEHTSDAIFHVLLRIPMPVSMPVEDQVDHFFAHAFIHECNEGTAAIYGYASAEELAGKDISVIIPPTPENREFQKQLFMNGYKLQDARSVEVDRLGKRKILLNNIFGRIEDGELYDFIGTARDITAQEDFLQQLKDFSQQMENEVVSRTSDLEQSREQLRMMNLELQRSNEDLLQFAHVVSHDLKEPVRKILIFRERLSKEYGEQLTGKAPEFLEKIGKSAGRIHSMINGVLEYSSLGRIREENPEQVDLNNLVQEVCQDLELLIQRSGASITMKDLPTLLGNRLLFFQLFYNLISNALKFSREYTNPEISITLENTPTTDLHQYCIKITDNGIGFDPADSEQIFRTFTRLHSKDRYEGTGLGLAFCKKIVERYGGIIEATGYPDKGATFSVYLPHNIVTTNSTSPDQDLLQDGDS